MLIGYLAVVRTASEAASVGDLLAEQASSALAGGGRTFRVTRLTDAIEKVLFEWDTKILKSDDPHPSGSRFGSGGPPLSRSDRGRE
jgi:hypothetical protein